VVATGGIINNQEYIGLVERLTDILGNGSGQTGYGQRVLCSENYGAIGNLLVQNDHWNALRTDINKAYNHQTGGASGITSIDNGAIIGADASGTSVTRISGTDTFTINGTNTLEGVNDFDTKITQIESSANSIAAGQFDLTTGRQAVNSSRTTPWGVNNINIMVYSEFTVEFEGGYTTTNSSGTSMTASATDHRRHFFNAGGEIRLSAGLTGSTAKDSDWGTLLGNMGQVIFGKNATTNGTGTGRARDGSTNVDNVGGIESALGNYQATTGYQLIFQKNGSQAEYAENLVAIYVKRNNTATTLTFLFEFYDNDSGDQTGIGPGVDENVLSGGGSHFCGLDFKRPNAANGVDIPAPAVAVQTELRLT
tara:strand:- start:10475 stop:11572 length:1098 start_codon:yes stop_codon:yes gene_type:complete